MTCAGRSRSRSLALPVSARTSRTSPSGNVLAITPRLMWSLTRMPAGRPAGTRAIVAARPRASVSMAQLCPYVNSIGANSAYAWDLSALTLCYSGNARKGLQRLEGSRELWERHPNPYWFRTTACIALSLTGQHEQAVAVGVRAVNENPNFQGSYRPLIASLGHAGRIGEARRYIAELKHLEPDFSIDWLRANYPPEV